MKKKITINLTGYSERCKENGHVILVLIDKDKAVHAEIDKNNLSNKDFVNAVVNTLSEKLF